MRGGALGQKVHCHRKGRGWASRSYNQGSHPLTSHTALGALILFFLNNFPPKHLRGASFIFRDGHSSYRKDLCDL